MFVQITYRGYCQLGGAANPRLMSRCEYNGKHFVGTSYWLHAF